VCLFLRFFCSPLKCNGTNLCFLFHPVVPRSPPTIPPPHPHPDRLHPMLKIREFVFFLDCSRISLVPASRIRNPSFFDLFKMCVPMSGLIVSCFCLSTFFYFYNNNFGGLRDWGCVVPRWGQATPHAHLEGNICFSHVPCFPHSPQFFSPERWRWVFSGKYPPSPTLPDSGFFFLRLWSWSTFLFCFLFPVLTGSCFWAGFGGFFFSQRLACHFLSFPWGDSHQVFQGVSGLALSLGRSGAYVYPFLPVKRFIFLTF